MFLNVLFVCFFFLVTQLSHNNGHTQWSHDNTLLHFAHDACAGLYDASRFFLLKDAKPTHTNFYRRPNQSHIAFFGFKSKESFSLFLFYLFIFSFLLSFLLS